MSGRCGTCKHWQRYTHAQAVEWHGAHAGLCVSDKFVYSGMGHQDDVPLDSLMYWDYEGYQARFHTGQDFGCIHWAGAQPNEQ